MVVVRFGMLVLATIALDAIAIARTVVVGDTAAFQAEVSRLAPGDTIVLANGIWRDARLDFFATGTSSAPIALRAETPGRVVLSGRSNLRLAGAHLQVSGLVFRNGYTPTGEVIAFRGEPGRVARHSRVTQVVIDRYNRPDRRESDHWVAIYGVGNRFDHSHIEGKTNQGATLIVVRDPLHGLDNRARIDHNYFGPRPNLGSNGGETIRIGTSHESRSASNTIVENNYFDHCDGEVEIISNKSGGNIYRGNVFDRSRGALTLRHGHGNLVENNIFLGGGKPHTGGIRVINRDQTVRGNYLEGLAGRGFASALAVLNGVPNSPLNRYDPVENATITGNSIIASRAIELGAGADAERSVPPSRSRFERNLIVAPGRNEVVQVSASVAGLSLAGNVRTPVEAPVLGQGFAERALRLERAPNGLLYPVGLDGVGASRALKPVTKAETGVAWYPKDQKIAALGTGVTRTVEAGRNLADAVRAAGPGDTLVIAAGTYVVDEVLGIDKPLSIVGPASGAAVIGFTRPTLFRLDDGGRLRLAQLTITGRAAPDAAGNAVIRTAEAGLGQNYELVIEKSRFEDLNVNNAFSVVVAGRGALADRIAISNSVFERVTGSVIDADAETDDLGLYNAEVVDVVGSTFRAVDGPIVSLYRGGTDESTFGPRLTFIRSIVERSGRRAGRSLRLHGVQAAAIRASRFVDSAPIEVTHTVGEPETVIAGNDFAATPAPRLVELIFKGQPRARLVNNVVQPEVRP